MERYLLMILTLLIHVKYMVYLFQLKSLLHSYQFCDGNSPLEVYNRVDYKAISRFIYLCMSSIVKYIDKPIIMQS